MVMQILPFMIYQININQTVWILLFVVIQIKVDFKWVFVNLQECNLQDQIKKRHMTKPGLQKVGELIGQMSHYDPDNMEMAAKRISELIISKEITFDQDPQLAHQITEAFMKQIQSQNDTVQSEAIKYLADIVPNLPSQEVELIFQNILEQITRLEESEKKRERYGACAATVIHQAAEEYGSKLGNLFLKSIQKLLQHQDKKIELEIILINIITEFIKKWPNVAARLKYDRRSLIIYLLRNLQLKTKLQIIKKSESCLGKLALILDRNQIHLALNDSDWGLLRFISRNSSKPSVQSLKQARNGLLCLSQVLKSHNIELRYWAKEMSHLLLNTINQFKGSDDLDNIQVICDILDASLTSLSFVVRTFSRQIRQQMLAPQSPYSSFLKELLQFNVEGMMIYAGQEMQEQGYDEYDGYYEQAEADQKCWKVRRAVLYYISFLVRYDKQFLQSLKEGELIEDLGSKLIQQHSMVSEMAFSTFHQLIELISIDRTLTSDDVSVEELSLQRVKSSAKDIADRIIKQIQSRVRIILNNSKFNDQLKAQSSKILLKLVQIYNHHLVSNEEQTFTLADFLIEELKRTTIPECRVNLLQSLRELISEYYPFARYQIILRYCLEGMVKNNSVKMQNNCLLTLRKFLLTFPKDISTNAQHMGQILQILKNKIKELDCDKVIKMAICRCIGALFSHYILSHSDLTFFLQSFSHKLKIQVQKTYIINTLTYFGKQQPLSNDVVKALQEVIRQTSESLGSSNYELNLKAVDTISHLLSIMEAKCPQKLMEDLLERSRILFGEGRIPSFVGHIADHHPKLLKPHAELIVKSTESKYIVALIKHNVIDVKSCLAILKNIDHEKAKKISETIGAINLDENSILKEVNESLWGRIMVVALGYVGSQQTLPVLHRFLGQFKSDQAKIDVCSAIGHIISKNPQKLLSAFLGKISSDSDIYMNLCIIKEMLGFTKNSFSSLSFLIEWLFSKSQQKLQSQSNYYIISECIGRLAFLDADAVRRVIANAQAQHPNRRLVVASSLRFALQNQAELNEELLDSYIASIIKLTNDEKVGVRQGAVKSLATVAQCHSRGVRQFAHDKSFWQGILKNAKINDSLITVIDYGLCKEIKDDGKNLRLESFNLLQMLTKKVPIETFIIEESMETALHRINDQNSNDIILKRLTVIRSLCELDFSPFIRLQNQFIAKVNPKDGLLKKYEKGLSEQRLQIYLRGILRQIWQINILAKQQNVDKLSQLIVELRNSAFYQPLIEQLQANK